MGFLPLPPQSSASANSATTASKLSEGVEHDKPSVRVMSGVQPALRFFDFPSEANANVTLCVSTYLFSAGLDSHLASPSADRYTMTAYNAVSLLSIAVLPHTASYLVAVGLPQTLLQEYGKHPGYGS